MLDGAIEFDGFDDYVDTGYTDNLATWTISAWVNSPGTPSGQRDAGPVHREQNFQINRGHGDPAFRTAAALNVGGFWYVASFGTLDSHAWYHLTDTYDGQALCAYKNGAAVTTNDLPSGNPNPDGHSLKLGRHARKANYFGGKVDDVRIYNRVVKA